MHQTRIARLGRIRAADPGRDYPALYRDTVLLDFWSEMRLGFNLGFYRTFTIPAIAELLVQTGEITGRTRKRAEDTALVILEMVANGLNHPRGRDALRVMNRAHACWTISNDDLRYVLGCFCLVPLDWIDRYGWRRVEPNERMAAWLWWRDVAHHMNIRDLPTTLTEYQDWFADYERDRARPSRACATLMHATHHLLVGRFPRPMAPLVRPMVTELLDEPLRQAAGVPRPGWLAGAGLRALLKLRAIQERGRPARQQPEFEPGGSVISYPDGYQITDLGPTT